MGFTDTFKRFAGFTVMRLLGIYELREQLSQNQPVANRPRGTAILAAHLQSEQQDAHDSLLFHHTR